MNNFVVEVRRTDGFTYWVNETFSIKTNLTIEELFCKIDDRLKGRKSIILGDYEIYPDEDWSILPLEEWLNKSISVT